MSKFLIFVLLLCSFSVHALSVVCTEKDAKLSKQNHHLLNAKSSSFGKDKTGYTVTFPAGFEGLKVSGGLLLIGDEVGSMLLTPLELTPGNSNDNNFSVYVIVSTSFKERKYVQVTYGSCLLQTIELM